MTNFPLPKRYTAALAVERAAWFCVIINALLAIAKLCGGWWGNSLAVLGDGIDTLFDVALCLAAVMAARYMNKPPDMDHPYGHARAEAVTTKGMAFVIALVACQIALRSIQSLISSEEIPLPGIIAVAATCLSLCGKGVLVWTLARWAAQLDSGLLRATAINMRADMILSLGVLLGLLLTLWANLPRGDAIIALLVSAWLLRAAWQLFQLANYELMDGVADTSLYEDIIYSVSTVEHAHHPHRMRARKHGNHWLTDLDIEVDGDLRVHEAHTISRAVEDAIRLQIDNVYDIVVHVEPLGNIEEDERFGVHHTHV